MNVINIDSIDTSEISDFSKLFSTPVKNDKKL